MSILVAGTFSRIHIGHEKLIMSAYNIADKSAELVEISLASDMYAKKYKKHYVSLFDRMKIMETYLEDMYGCDWCENFIITSFDSPFDGVDDRYITTIVCSQETLMNVLAFNKMRAVHNIPEVNIYCIPLTLNDFGKKLSSTELIENE